MTEEERERSQRQRAFDLIEAARKRVNPKTTEHIAEVAQRHAEDDLQDYIRLYGWRQMVRDQEHQVRGDWRRPTRSGHQNASGRYAQLRNILDMPVEVDEQHLVLGELDLVGVQSLIAKYERKASELLEETERLQRIATAMKDEGVEIVADLGSERVELLYTGEVVS
jgi:hypothetical protein